MPRGKKKKVEEVNQVQNLTLSVVQEENKKFEEQFEVTIKGYKLKIDTQFRPTKIGQLIAELVQKYDQTKVKDENALSVIYIPYIMLLVIKHFTSLEIPEKLEQQLDILDMLVDNGFFKPILEAMPKDELNKVFDRIKEAKDEINSVMDEFMDKVEDIDFENEEVQNLLDK